MDHKKIQKKVDEIFTESFGRTPLTKRLDDIEGGCREVCQYTDLKNLREETGDLLASLIQLCNESGWDISELLAENEEKIKRRQLQYKSLGRKTRVCILPIAGNPITKAHVMVAELILNVAKMDEVHISLDNNHLEKKLESSEHRLEMARLAVSDNPRIKISDYQIKHNLGGEAYHYINKITNDKEWENYRFFYAMGLDRANTLLETWYNAEELIKLDVGFVVVPREGYERDESVKWYLEKPNIYLEKDINSKIPNISSTMARKWIDMYNKYQEESVKLKVKKELCKILDEKVVEYIFENKLYNIIDI
jgi:nicotinate (nicotinamide) nucleotide adenylyltransferase